MDTIGVEVDFEFLEVENLVEETAAAHQILPGQDEAPLDFVFDNLEADDMNFLEENATEDQPLQPQDEAPNQEIEDPYEKPRKSNPQS